MVFCPENSLESSMPLRVSLVNLQKLTLSAWVEPASMRILAPAQNTRGLPERSSMTLTSRMLEAQPLQRVGELDIDAEIVGIELELVALEQAALLVDVHGERRDVAVDGQFPVPVARGIGLKIYPGQAVSELASALGHPWTPFFGGF